MASPADKPDGPLLQDLWPRSVQQSLCLLLCGALLVLAGYFVGRGSVTGPSRGELRQTGSIDLNRASAAELVVIPGIGETLAQRIVDHRRQVGSFASVDDLREVPGIGPKTLERLRHYVVAPVSATAAGPKPGGVQVPPKKVETLAGALIPLNRAGIEDLQKLPGIGPKLSQRIVEHRSAKGPFRSIDDLRQVSGIGPKTLDKIRPYLSLGTETLAAVD